jgi:hypothetical protein
MTTLSNALNTWLAAGDTASMREAVRTMHPADIANEIGGMPPQDAARVLTALPPDRQGMVFGYFDAPFQIAMAKSLPRAELARIVTAMRGGMCFERYTLHTTALACNESLLRYTQTGLLFIRDTQRQANGAARCLRSGSVRRAPSSSRW